MIIRKLKIKKEVMELAVKFYPFINKTNYEIALRDERRLSVK